MTRIRLSGIAIIGALFLFVASATAVAQDSLKLQPAVTLSGYVKMLDVLEFPRNIGDGYSSDLLHNRLNIEWNISEELSAKVGIRNRIFHGEDIHLIPNYANMIAQDPGFFNLSRLWVNERSLIIQSIADRAYLRFTNDSWDVRLGRQRINWGINTVWNPNDLFNAYNFLDFDYEERPGADAVRLAYSLTSTSGIEAAFAPSRDNNGSVGAALYKFNQREYDVQILAGIYQTDAFAGIGWAGNLWTAGFKGELTYFHPRSSTSTNQDALSTSVSFDEAIDGYFITLSGLYSSAASQGVLSLTSLMQQSLSPKMLMPFRYSYYAGASKSFTPLFSIAAAIIYSPTFQSLILFPTLSYSLAQNVDADFIAESFFNNASGVYTSDANAFFLRVQWSF